MKFVIKIKSNQVNGRVGVLSGFRTVPGAIIETPTSALLTQGGSVVHLTAEVLAKVFTKPQLLWVPLSNTLQLEEGIKAQNMGIAKFAGLPQHITCSTLSNVSEETPLYHFQSDNVPLWTRNGKILLSANRYMDIMEVFKPDIILAIADGHTSLKETNKRVYKAVHRTSNLLNVCVERFKQSSELQQSSLIGVIVGAADLKRSDEVLNMITKHADTLSGVALEGITDGSDDYFNKKPEDLTDIFEKFGNALPESLVRIVEGAWNPAVVLSAIECGWDIFDGSYVVKLTQAGLALKLNYDMSKETSTPYILDIKDKCYEEDFQPILEDCECLACRKHTRAYIHHLLHTRELLAPVLLNIHNLHHFDQMFYHARQHLTAKTFKQYREHVTKQCEHYNNIPYRNRAFDDANTKEEVCETKKTKRVE